MRLVMRLGSAFGYTALPHLHRFVHVIGLAHSSTAHSLVESIAVS